MADVLERFNFIKQEIEKRANQLAGIHAKLELTESQIKDTFAEIEQLGIKPEELQAEIVKLEAALIQETELLEKQLASLPPLDAMTTATPR
jgi:peptidoglycan hydrolase CwlO-like protein